MSELSDTGVLPGAVIPGEGMLRALVDESPDGLIVVDRSGRILLVNPKIVKMLGYDRSDLLGASVEMLLPEGRRRQHRAYRASFARDPRSRPMGLGLDLSARGRDASTFPVEISLTPLDAPNGPLVIATVRDVSERRAAAVAEQELTSLRAIAEVVSLHRSLTTAVSVGRGLVGIADAVQQVTGGTVVVEDLEGTSSASAGGPGPETPLPSPDRRRARLRHATHAQAFRDGDWLVAVARPDGEVRGAVSLLDPDAKTGEAEAFALEQAASVLATELFRLRSIAETELKVWGDLMSELLNSTDLSVSRAHAAALGYDIDHPQRIILIETSRSRLDKLLAAVRRTLGRFHLRTNLVTARAAGLAVVVDPDLDWAKFAQVLSQEARSRHRIGVGGRYGPDGLRRSLAEAQLALRLSSAPVVLFDHLGVWRFLAADADPATLGSFVRDWIGVLIDYDKSHNAELVKTLTTHLESSGGLEVTAARLHVHPSTLKYRLRRIRDLTGRDLRDAEHRFNLDLACRAEATRSALSENP